MAGSRGRQAWAERDGWDRTVLVIGTIICASGGLAVLAAVLLIAGAANR